MLPRRRWERSVRRTYRSISATAPHGVLVVRMGRAENLCPICRSARSSKPADPCSSSALLPRDDSVLVRPTCYCWRPPGPCQYQLDRTCAEECCTSTRDNSQPRPPCAGSGHSCNSRHPSNPSRPSLQECMRACPSVLPQNHPASSCLKPSEPTYQTQT